jgi:hypothetical protein
MLKNTKKKRLRDALRYRSDAYQKLQDDEAFGTISDEQYNQIVKDIEKETANRAETSLADHVLPSLITAGGLGAGYLGYKYITGQNPAASNARQ